MKMLLHDLTSEAISILLSNYTEEVRIVSEDHAHHCIGCFGCWIKTPGTCVIKDEYANLGECLSKFDEVVIFSQCFYGGFSPAIKKALDRSISYNHPYFEIRNGEMHHKRRYQNKINLKVIFYGESVTEQEKETARKLVQANAINLDCTLKSIDFVTEITKMEEAIA